MECNGDTESAPPQVETEIPDTRADFETAVSATGFGLFNVLLLMAVIPAGWTSVFDTSNVAFIMPSAECDLDLTLIRKGILAAMTYAGMVCTAYIWGFIADHVGRKYLLLFGLVSDAVCNIFGSASQSYYVFLSLKFVNGIIVGGPFAILMTYIAEFHGELHRTRVLMWTGSLFALGNIAVPALARAILPLPWTFSLFNDSLVFNSWRIFLLICSLPPVVGSLTMSFFPESPKFLMTNGRHEEALRVFRSMYSMNTGKSGDTYPIKALSFEFVPERKASWAPSRRASHVSSRRASLVQTRSLFAAPYIFPLFIVSAVLFASMSGMHIMKSWLPQLIVILNHFDPKDWTNESIAPTICQKLDFESIEAFGEETFSAVANATETCIPMVVSPTVYTNATIIAASAVLGSFLAGFIVNRVGKKSILLTSVFISVLCVFGINWSPSTKVFLIVASACIGMTGIATNTITAMVIEVVPTTLRATAVSVTVTAGRLGALTGNVLFPILLNVSCDAPFFYIGGFLALGFVLAIFLKKYSGKLQ